MLLSTEHECDSVTRYQTSPFIGGTGIIFHGRIIMNIKGVENWDIMIFADTVAYFYKSDKGSTIGVGDGGEFWK